MASFIFTEEAAIKQESAGQLSPLPSVPPPPPVLISNPYVPGSVEHAIRPVRLSGDSCTDKISTDVFFEQAGSGPSGNDHCFSEIRTAGAGAGVVGDEVSPQQPLPPAGVGNSPEDKPKTEPHDTEISEEEKGKNGEGSRVGQGQASNYPPPAATPISFSTDLPLLSNFPGGQQSESDAMGAQ